MDLTWPEWLPPWLSTLADDPDFALLALLFVTLGLWKLLRVLFRRRPSGGDILVDGSNVMHWDEQLPDLRSLRLVLNSLEDAGLRPIVWFDANAGWLVSDRWMSEHDLARALRMNSSRQLRVAPKGTPADPGLLAEATRRGLRIVTNDRYRDWYETFPILKTRRDLLVRGRIADGKASLDLDAPGARVSSSPDAASRRRAGQAGRR